MVGVKSLGKTVLHATGLFPIVRAAARKLDRSLQADLRTDYDLYSKFISPGDLVFDIGVNLGQKSAVFLNCGAKVIGAEPNPLCRPTLKYEFGNNPNFSLVAAAVGSAQSEMELNFSGTSSTASLRQDWRWVGIEGEPQKTLVQVTTLDALIDQYGLPTFCKIDVEGFEDEVLRGLSRPLKCVSFEYHIDEPERLTFCLNHLSGLSPIWINAIDMNTGNFIFERWTDAVDYERLPPAGDMFVVTEDLN